MLLFILTLFFSLKVVGGISDHGHIVFILTLFLSLKVVGGVVADPGHVALQARPSLHPRRGGCCSRLYTHAERRTDAEKSLHTLSVCDRISQGWHVQQRQRSLQDGIR